MTSKYIIKSSAILVVIGSLGLGYIPAQAQKTKIPAQFIQIEKLPASQFEKWVYLQATTDNAEANAAVVAALVLNRIEQDLNITDETLRVSVDYWRATEDKENIAREEKDKTAKYSYLQTRGYIDQLLPLIKDRPLPRGLILVSKAETYRLENDMVSAAKAYEESTQTLTALRTDIDIARTKAYYQLGESLLNGVKDNKNAEQAYLEVLAYPFWKIHGNPDLLRTARILYGNAAIRLIEIHKGDLNTLELYRKSLAPAVMNVVGPPLARAIQAAGGKVEPAELIDEPMRNAVRNAAPID